MIFNPICTPVNREGVGSQILGNRLADLMTYLPH